MADDTYKVEADFSELDAAVAKAIGLFEKMSVSVINNFAVASNTAIASLDKIRVAADAMWATMTGGVSLITGGLSKAFSVVLSPVKAVFSAITGIVNTTVGLIKNAFSTVTSYITGAFTGVFGVVKEMLPLLGIGLFAGISHGLAELQATQDGFARVKGLVESTGRIAGISADKFKDMADEMQRTTRFGDDAALQAQAVALQFKNVRGDILVKALNISANAALAWKMDLSAATEKVTRALDDPLEGFRRLASEGVKFTQEQKMMIEQMLAVGNVAGAQSIMLRALADDTAAAGAADKNTLGFAIAQTNNKMNDMWKTIAGVFEPALKRVVNWFGDGADKISTWAPKLKALVDEMTAWATSTLGTLEEWRKKTVDTFTEWYDAVKSKVVQVAEQIIDSMANAAGFIKTAFTNFDETFSLLKAEGALAFDWIKNTAFDVFDQLLEKGKTVWSSLMAAFDTTFGESMDLMFERFKQASLNINAFNPVKFLTGDFGDTYTEQDVQEALGRKKQARELAKKLGEGKGATEFDVSEDRRPFSKDDPLRHDTTVAEMLQRMRTVGAGGFTPQQATMERAAAAAQEENDQRRLQRIQKIQEYNAAIARGETPAPLSGSLASQDEIARGKAAEARKAKTAELEASVKKAKDAFAAPFEGNAAPFKDAAERAKAALRRALGTTEENNVNGGGRRGSNEPFTFNRTPEEGKAGRFEDLLSLQKRIAGASSTAGTAGTPAEQAQIKMPKKMDDLIAQAKEAKAQAKADRLAEKEERRRELEALVLAQGLA